MLGAFEVTVELGETKAPDPGELPEFWNANRNAFLAYMEAAHIGVCGRVTDAATGDPLFAEIRVEENAHPIFTDPDVGDYHRPLLSGSYTVEVAAPGYRTTAAAEVQVPDGAAVRQDVVLEHAPHTATRTFPEARFTAGAANTVEVVADIGTGREAPNAFIIGEALPRDWDCVPGTSEADGVAMAGPRGENGS